MAAPTPLGMLHMTLSARLCSIALLAVTMPGPVAAAIPDAPFRLRCEIDFGNAEPTVQYYRIDPAAGEVLGEPGARYTRAGTPQESEALIGVYIIESWTADEIVFRWDTRSRTGPQSASFRDVLNLEALTLRVESVMNLGAVTPSPGAHPGRCKRVALDPAAAK
jgi:hypothetical protein